MWIFTNVGFYSVVQKPGEEYLTVRARVKSDLDRLREQYMPRLSTTVEGVGSDYEYRAVISHRDFAAGMIALVLDITYPNFEQETLHRFGYSRNLIYSRVWSLIKHGFHP